jgi:hypothetical protein
MDIQRVRNAMEALLAANPESADRDELAEHVRTVRGLRNHLDAFELRCTRRGRELAEEGRAEPPESLFANQGGQSGRRRRQPQSASASPARRTASKMRSASRRCRRVISTRWRWRRRV